MPPASPAPRPDSVGLYSAVAAYGLWGLVPIYFKAVAHVGALEVLAHRVVWSLLLLAVVVWIARRGAALRGLLANPRLVWGLVGSALLVAINWLVFIWAVAEGRILETSLGYFICPLVSVLLGTLWLAERLRPLQWLAVALAAGGVLNEIVGVGYLPWAALALALSFGCYGLVRKRLAVDATLGLTVETLVLLPAALMYLWWLQYSAQLSFINTDRATSWLLVAAGLVTSVPLLCYAVAANRLTLTALGLMQYLTPSLTLILAVLVYREPFALRQWLTFGLIWLGLVLFTAEGWRHQRTLVRALRRQ